MKNIDYRLLTLTLIIVFFIGCATTSAIVQPPKEKTPEDIVNEWLTFAKEQKWEKMVKIAQITWVSKKGYKAAEEISWNYDFFDIKEWRIVATSKLRDTFYTITVDVDTQLGIKTMKANVIREMSPYQESVNGKWGINPISAMLH